MNEKQLELFKAACAKKGISSEIPDMSGFPEDLRKFMLATYILAIVCEAANDGWRADWTDYDQEKYFPWARLERNEDNSSGLALACSHSDWASADAAATVGSRLCLKDSKTSDEVFGQFTDIWIDFYQG